MAGWGGPGRGGGDRRRAPSQSAGEPQEPEASLCAARDTAPPRGAGRARGREAFRPRHPHWSRRSRLRCPLRCPPKAQPACQLAGTSIAREAAAGFGRRCRAPSSGEWRLGAGGERGGGGGGRQLRRQLKGLWRRAGKDGGDRRGTPETVPPVPSSGSQGPGGPGPSRARPVLWTRWQRRRGETVLGDRLAAGAREGRGWRAQGVCP